MNPRKARLSQLVRDLQGDLSIRELARRLDLAVGTIEGWRNGRTLPDLDNLYRLAEYARMRPDDLLRYLDEGILPDQCSTEQIAGWIARMEARDLAVVLAAVSQRLAVG